MATNPDHETFLIWLRDAYALEKKLVPELQAHAGQAEGNPVMQGRIRAHIQQTEGHAERVRGIIESLGGEISTIKTIAGQVMGFMMGASTAVAADAMVKNALAEFTMEHLEIASYTSLIAAAERLGLQEAVPVLREILREEEEMAAFLRQQISVVTLDHLGKRQQTTAAA